MAFNSHSTLTTLLLHFVNRHYKKNCPQMKIKVVFVVSVCYFLPFLAFYNIGVWGTIVHSLDPIITTVLVSLELSLFEFWTAVTSRQLFQFYIPN